MALQRPEVFLVDEDIREGSHLTHHMAPQGLLIVNDFLFLIFFFFS